MFLGLNPLFVSPRDDKEGKPDPIHITVAVPCSPRSKKRSLGCKSNKNISSNVKRIVSEPKKARKLPNKNKPQKNQPQHKRPPRNKPRAHTPKAMTPKRPKSESTKSKSPRSKLQRSKSQTSRVKSPKSLPSVRSRGISNSKSNSNSNSKSKSKGKSQNKSDILDSKQRKERSGLGSELLNNDNNQIQINNNYLSLTYNQNGDCQPMREKSKSGSLISQSGSSETSDAESDHSNISITSEINETNDERNIVYQILTKQRNDAIEYAQKLESKLAEKDVEFALKIDKFQQQLKQYKNTNNSLKTQNVSLKREIQKLKDKMMALELNQHKNFDDLLKKRKKINSNKSKKLPNYIRKDFKQQEIVIPDKLAAEKRKDMTQRLNHLRFISEQQRKQKQQQQQQYQIQVQDMDNLRGKKRTLKKRKRKKREREQQQDEHEEERPFIKHGRSTTESTEGSSDHHYQHVL